MGRTGLEPATPGVSWSPDAFAVVRRRPHWRADLGHWSPTVRDRSSPFILVAEVVAEVHTSAIRMFLGSDGDDVESFVEVPEVVGI